MTTGILIGLAIAALLIGPIKTCNAPPDGGPLIGIAIIAAIVAVVGWVA